MIAKAFSTKLTERIEGGLTLQELRQTRASAQRYVDKEKANPAKQAEVAGAYRDYLEGQTASVPRANEDAEKYHRMMLEELRLQSVVPAVESKIATLFADAIAIGRSGLEGIDLSKPPRIHLFVNGTTATPMLSIYANDDFRKWPDIARSVTKLLGEKYPGIPLAFGQYGFRGHIGANVFTPDGKPK
jgi:hypothetical protein